MLARIQKALIFFHVPISNEIHLAKGIQVLFDGIFLILIISIPHLEIKEN